MNDRAPAKCRRSCSLGREEAYREIEGALAGHLEYRAYTGCHNPGLLPRGLGAVHRM
jgi:hypothetical protein